MQKVFIPNIRNITGSGKVIIENGICYIFNTKFSADFEDRRSILAIGNEPVAIINGVFTIYSQRLDTIGLSIYFRINRCK